jgi:hypothetical protein
MQITIDLPPTLQSQLSEQATQLNIPLEALILQVIHQYVQTPQPHLDPNYDPITPLIGTLDLGTTDLGENHDYYIGQSLMEDLHPTA